MKQSVWLLNVGTLLFLVLIVGLHFGTKFIEQVGAFSFIILNTQHKHLYNLLDLSDSSSNSWWILSREVTCIAPVIANLAFYCTDSSFSQKYSFWDIAINHFYQDSFCHKSCTIFVISSPFLSILVACFFIGITKIMYFSVFSPKQVNYFFNSSANSFMIKW